MALTVPQKVTVAEITRETYGTINDRAGSLNSDQEASIILDIATWATIRDKHVRLAPGAKGNIDFDNERKREAIRERVRKALGLPLYSAEYASGGGQSSGSVENEPVW